MKHFQARREAEGCPESRRSGSYCSHPPLIYPYTEDLNRVSISGLQAWERPCVGTIRRRLGGGEPKSARAFALNCMSFVLHGAASGIRSTLALISIYITSSTWTRRDCPLGIEQRKRQTNLSLQINQAVARSQRNFEQYFKFSLLNFFAKNMNDWSSTASPQTLSK